MSRQRITRRKSRALCVIGVEPRKVTADEMEKIRKIARYVDMRLMAEGLRNRREGA